MDKIHTCVAAWLWDIRFTGEQECTSILLAKSILPAENVNFCLNSSIYEDSRKPRNWSQNSSQTVVESPEAELILGGKIPVDGSETNGDSFCSEFDSGCGISLLPEETSTFKTPVSSQDSALTSSENESEPKKRQNLRLLGQDEDNSSLDSACGSSPMYSSSQNNSPVRTASPLAHEVNQPIPAIHRAGIPFLPSYVDLRDTLDKILLTSNHLYSQLNELNRNPIRADVTFDVIREFISLTEHSCCNHFVSYEDLYKVKSDLGDLCSEYSKNPSAFYAPLEFVDCVKSLAENVFSFFAKVVVRHLSESGSDNVFLPYALEHMSHLALFGEEICLEVIRVGGVNCLLRLCRQISTPTEVLRLALRSLTVLCGVSKGCVQLLSIGGLDLVVKLLCEAPFITAVEAAGVLTQLTAPCHSYSAMPVCLPKVISRLLDLCDQSRGPDAFLQCSAALANLTIQQSSVSEQLYKENAVLRLSKACNTATCQSIFTQDQIATIFARLSANGYNEALIAQGSIPCLLSLIQIHSTPRQRDLCKRIRYKSAICLGTIASTGYGLKAINDNQGTYVLRKICKLDRGEQKRDPVQAICYSLLVRLTDKYETESAV